MHTPLNSETWEAIILTLKLAASATALLMLLATPLAWWLSQTASRWRAPVGALVTLPLVLPPSVLGFYLLVSLGPQGPLGQLTQALGWGRVVLHLRRLAHRLGAVFIAVCGTADTKRL